MALGEAGQPASVSPAARGGWGGVGGPVHSGFWVPTAEKPARALLPGPEGNSERSVTSHNSQVPTAQTGTRGSA